MQNLIKAGLSLILLTLAIQSKAHPPVGVVQDSKGNVYYSDLNHVWKISPLGKKSIAVENVHTHQLYIDHQDNLYGEHEWYNGEVEDTWGNYTWCLSVDGILEKTAEKETGFLDNTKLIRDLNGKSYWHKKENGIDKLYVDNLSQQSKLFTNHSFKNIRWLYYSKHTKLLYVLDVLQLKTVNKDGKVQVLVDNIKQDAKAKVNMPDHHYAFGMWTDNLGNLYLAVYAEGKILKVDSQGNSKVIYESEDDWLPCGGTQDSNGTCWILETKDNQVRLRNLNFKD